MIWDKLLGGLISLADEFIEDKDKKAEFKLRAQELVAQNRLAQNETNREEIKSGHILGKWRGVLGWGATIALLYQIVVYPTMVAFMVYTDEEFDPSVLPTLELKQLASILVGMLGL